MSIAAWTRWFISRPIPDSVDLPDIDALAGVTAAADPFIDQYYRHLHEIDMPDDEMMDHTHREYDMHAWTLCPEDREDLILERRYEWKAQPPVKYLNPHFFPLLELHVKDPYLQPLIHYGIKLPQAALMTYATTVLKLNKGPVWEIYHPRPTDAYLKLPARWLAEGEHDTWAADDNPCFCPTCVYNRCVFRASPDGPDIAYQLVQREALQCIEKRLGISTGTLQIELSLSDGGAYVLSFVTNHNPNALTAAEIASVMDELDLPAESRDLAWWLGSTGVWTHTAPDPTPKPFWSWTSSVAI